MHVRKSYVFYFIMLVPFIFFFFFFNDTATTEIYTLSLHDALPISFAQHGNAGGYRQRLPANRSDVGYVSVRPRSEEHTSELQSPCNLVCRLLLEKKKKIKIKHKDMTRLYEG